MPGGSVVVVQVAMVAKIRRPWFNPTLGCGITSLGASFSLSSAIIITSLRWRVQSETRIPKNEPPSIN